MQDKIAIPKNILVAKLCCIGDIIFITPMLRALRNAFPEAGIYYLAVPWVKDIVEQINDVDDVILYEAPLSDKSSISKGFETLRLIGKLRSLNIDTMFIGHRNKTFALLGKLAGIPIRIGFSEEQSNFLTHPIRFDPAQYEIERYFELLKPLSVFPTDITTRITPLDSEIKLVEQTLSPIGISNSDRIIGIFAGGGENPGTIMPIKRWYPEKYAELCSLVLRNDKTKVLLIGGPTDYQLNETILSNLTDQKENILNVAKMFSLRSLPALMQRCSVVVGGDTGPMHIAAAVGTATVFLYGPSDPRLVAPRNTNSKYIWKQVECSPCYTPETVMQKKNFEGKTFSCWTGTHECIKAITVEDVLHAVTSVNKQLNI